MAEKKTVSIKSSLLINLLVLILLSSAAILATYQYGVRKAVRSLSKSIIHQAAEHIESQLYGFFTPLSHDLLVATEWAMKGVFELDDVPAMNRLFQSIIDHQPQISSIHVADSEGREYLILKTGSGWLNRESNPEEWGAASRITEWNGRDLPLLEWRDIDYDARKRPWYQGAVGKLEKTGSNISAEAMARIYWTGHYTFFTTKDPGITAAVAFNRADGSFWVIAFDLTLNDISRFTTELEVSENGEVVVLSDDKFRVIGLPLIDRFRTENDRREALLKTPAELGIPLLTNVVDQYQKEAGQGEMAFEFESHGQSWWGGVRPFALTPDRFFYITVVVPNRDLLGQLQQLRIWIFAIILATVLLTILRVLTLTRRYSAPVEALVEESRRISHGDLSPGERINTRVKEFRRLAQAQEDLRKGLQELLKLERDLQVARQIQQDTFPRRLPNLKGYQLAAWNEPAEAAGGDTYDVIGLLQDPATGSLKLTDQQTEHAIFLLADATGHGIGPALSVTQVRAMFRMALRLGDEMTPIVRHMNAQLADDLKEGRFITAWFGKLDVSRHELVSFSAGQAPFFHFDGTRKTCTVYSADMPPFGLLEDMDAVLTDPIKMNPGDLFVVLSDGLIEPHSAAGSMYGKDRVIDMITQHLDDRPEDILKALVEDIESFTGGAPPDDDRTAILIKRKAAS